MSNGFTISTPEGIAHYRLASAFAVAKLDLQGIKMRHTRNAWAILAQQYQQAAPKSRKQKLALVTLAAPDFPVMGLPYLQTGAQQ